LEVVGCATTMPAGEPGPALIHRSPVDVSGDRVDVTFASGQATGLSAR
jgi:hypothetical protein